jgi:hypothetical protein
MLLLPLSILKAKVDIFLDVDLRLQLLLGPKDGEFAWEYLGNIKEDWEKIL